jgi:hypothetical protein
MAILRRRLPSRQQLLPVLAACAVPVYSWSIVAFFHKLPSWLLQLSLWDLVGAFAYTQVFALFEAALVLASVVGLCLIVPRRLLRDKFVAQGGTLVLLSSGWAVAVQLRANQLRSWGLRKFAVLALLYLLSIGVSYALIRRFGRLETAIGSLVDRLTVLLFLYGPLTAASLIVVFLRNV